MYSLEELQERLIDLDEKYYAAKDTYLSIKNERIACMTRIKRIKDKQKYYDKDKVKAINDSNTCQSQSIDNKAKRAYKETHKPYCEVCGEPMKDVHHIIPVREGGTNDEDNLICLCRSCHQKAHRSKYYDKIIKMAKIALKKEL